MASRNRETGTVVDVTG